MDRVSNLQLSESIIEHQRSMLQGFFEVPFNALSQEILKRYIEVTENLHMSIVPHTEEIHERLLKPLKSAKKSYCLGDYPATIASCGIVGEMLAILLWKINDVKLKDNSITKEDEKGLFGSSFEKLGQAKRLKILKTFRHIDDEQYSNFITVKDSRRPYLHLWTADLKNEREIALNVFKKSFQLFKDITDVGLVDAGTIKVNPLLLKLFENK